MVCGVTDQMGRGLERIQQSQGMSREGMEVSGDPGEYFRMLSCYLMKRHVAEKSEKGEFKGYVQNGFAASDVGQGLHCHKPVSRAIKWRSVSYDCKS